MPPRRANSPFDPCLLLPLPFPGTSPATTPNRQFDGSLFQWMHSPSAHAQVIRCARALVLLPEQLQSAMARYDQKPRSGSPASHELDACPAPQHVETAYALAIQRLFVVFDHLSALHRALAEPWLTYSPWTCARGALESCSVADWLLDATIGYRERVSRCFNLRLQNLRSQITFFRSEPEPPGDAIPNLEGRVAHLRTEARTLSIPEKRNRRGKFLGFDAGMPSHTQLIDRFSAESGPSTLGYPLLSAAAHGVNWAVGSLGSTTIVDEAGARREPELNPTYALWLVLNAIQWLSQPSWAYFVQYGWDLEEAARILEDAYDVAGRAEGERFWKHQ